MLITSSLIIVLGIILVFRGIQLLSNLKDEDKNSNRFVCIALITLGVISILTGIGAIFYIRFINNSVTRVPSLPQLSRF